MVWLALNDATSGSEGNCNRLEITLAKPASLDLYTQNCTLLRQRIVPRADDALICWRRGFYKWSSPKLLTAEKPSLGEKLALIIHAAVRTYVIGAELTNFVFAISVGPIMEIYASRYRDTDYAWEIRTETFAFRGHINQVPQCIIIRPSLFHLVSIARQ